MSDETTGVNLEIEALSDEVGVSFTLRLEDCKDARLYVYIPRGLSEDQGNALAGVVETLADILDQCVTDLERKAQAGLN